MSRRPPPKGILDYLVPGAPSAVPAFDAEGAMRAAVAHHQAGRMGEAEGLYRHILAAAPRHADALDMLGVLAWQSGRADEALDLVGRALSINKRNPGFHVHYGLALIAAGRRADAIKSLRRAVKLAPTYTDAHTNLGLALLKDGQPLAAIGPFKKAARLNPGDAETHNNLGTALAGSGRHSDAEPAFRRALEVRGDLVSAHGNLASTLLELGRPDEAAGAAEHGLSVQKTPDGHYIMGRIALSRREFEAALDHNRAALDLMPGMREARINLGLAFKGLGRHGEEVESNRALADVYPDAPEILNNYALSLVEWARRKDAGGSATASLEEAARLMERARALDPTQNEFLYSHAKVLEELNRDDDALAILDGLLARTPERHDARFMRGVLRLRTGDCDGGAEDIQWRWNNPEYEHQRRPFSYPWWAGEPIPEGRRLLVWGDQGIGDEIVYAGLMPLIEDSGIAATLECDPRLAGLFERSFPHVAVVERQTPPGAGAEAAEIAFQTPLSGLTHRLGPWPRGFPRRGRYLKTDPKRVTQCRDGLDGALDAPFRVGVSWISKRSDRPHEGWQKSVELLDWAPILRTPGVSFVNLQYGDTDADIVAVRNELGVAIHTDPTIDRFNDLEGLAALIESLDLVITISNATAHIAGALGKGCWVLARKAPFWYWSDTGDRAMFYDSVRVIRQGKSGEWKTVIEDAAANLLRRMNKD
jgi:tetratricopeptide (TPR) repeat protein